MNGRVTIQNSKVDNEGDSSIQLDAERLAAFIYSLYRGGKNS